MIADGSFRDQPLSDPGLIADLDKGANPIYMLVGELRALTGWDEFLLLKHLGCDPDAPHPDAALADRLRNHSIAYLTWVRDLCYVVDRSVDRHDILHGAYELCAGAGGQIDDRVARCRDACNVRGRDGLTGHQFMLLGEVAKGWLQAMAALEGTVSQQRAERGMDLTAPRGSDAPHLHPRRMRWLFAGQPELEREIGLNVGHRMREHVRGCPRCDAVAHELNLVSPWSPPG